MSAPVEIKLGLLVLIGQPSGAHVHVTVRSDSVPFESRALCGHFVVNEAEWCSLVGLEVELLALQRDLAREARARLEAVEEIERARLAAYGDDP